MQFINGILRPSTALMAGAVIGWAFGAIQEAALRRNEKRQQGGLPVSGWSVMPGSMTRVAMLLLVLVLAQVVWPLLFASDGQWWVSGGIVAGYGAVLVQQLRRRLAAGR